MTLSILVVDDDLNMRQLLDIHLRNVGYEVRTARDGIEAGYDVLRHRPDLIITDVQMPHMDGFEFVGALRADHSISAIPVVMLTSEADWEDRGKASGADGYVTKPVRLDQLLSTIATQLAKREIRYISAKF